MSSLQISIKFFDRLYIESCWESAISILTGQIEIYSEAYARRYFPFKYAYQYQY
jgi:hypothetical protein